MSTDALLDPVATHFLKDWTWLESGAYYGIPWTNFAGWFGVSFLVQCGLGALAGATKDSGHHPAVLRQSRLAYWIYAALLVLFATPAVAHGWFVPVLLAALPWVFAFTVAYRRCTRTLAEEETSA